MLDTANKKILGTTLLLFFVGRTKLCALWRRLIMTCWALFQVKPSQDTVLTHFGPRLY